MRFSGGNQEEPRFREDNYITEGEDEVSRPALFLDVDGTLLPDYWGSLPLTWGDWELVGRGSFRFPVSREMADAILELPMQPMWLTSHGQLANRDVSPLLGWPALPVLHPPALPTAGGRWPKLAAVLAWRERFPRRPFAWIDDDSMIATDDVTAALAESKVSFLLIQTVATVGIRQDHLEQIRNWLTDQVYR